MSNIKEGHLPSCKVRLGYFSKSSLEVHDLIPSDDSLLMSDPPDTNNIAFSFSSSKAS